MSRETILLICTIALVDIVALIVLLGAYTAGDVENKP